MWELQKTVMSMQKQEVKCTSCESFTENNSKTKYLIVLGFVFTIVIILLEILFDSNITNIVLLVLATPVQIILGKPFYTNFYNKIKQKKTFTVDTLVVVSTTIAYLYSLIATLAGSDAPFFEAATSVLTIFTLGEYIESRVTHKTSEGLKELLALKPKIATVLQNGKEEQIDADEIKINDIVIVKPGEKIATDGIITQGYSAIDESMVTGESIPVDKKEGDSIVGGTINTNGYLQFKANKVEQDTVLANIVRMVENAKTSKAHVQKIADRAVRYFIPIVFLIAISASLYWLLVAQEPISFVVTVFATILVVSCPCALGIATPMVVSLGIDKGTKQGILIKGGEYLEKLSSIDTLIFDKTGTITKGKPEVTDIISNGNYDESKILQWAYSVEVKSEHPIAHAIVKKAEKENITALELSDFSAIPGRGVLANYAGKEIFVGGQLYHKVKISQTMENKISNLESDGKTVIVIILEDMLIGIIAVADTLRDNAKQVINEIKNMGKNVILMSGDNKRTANAVGEELGIDCVIAEVLPETKAYEVKKLQIQGKKVIMVGDGINDAPALTQADVGIAIGSGTDVAMAAGHVILMKSDLQNVVFALKIGEYSLKKIKQNLTISFAYNAITIPIAAGILFGITNSLILTPGLAALGWIISDGAVFGNSMLMKKFMGVTKVFSEKK